MPTHFKIKFVWGVEFSPFGSFHLNLLLLSYISQCQSMILTFKKYNYHNILWLMVSQREAWCVVHSKLLLKSSFSVFFVVKSWFPTIHTPSYALQLCSFSLPTAATVHGLYPNLLDLIKSNENLRSRILTPS